MNRTLAPLLAELLPRYFDEDEFTNTAQLFGIELKAEYDFQRGTSAYWLSAATQLLVDSDQGNAHALLGMLLEQLELRNRKLIASTGWERRAAHEAYSEALVRLREAFEASGSPSEITTAEGKPFTAKSEVRELLAIATTDILVVDPYIGPGTLDCLRDVSTPIQILTGDFPQSIEPSFASALLDFKKEGFAIEVRRTSMQHDRHVVFNNRCWLVGSSLKDAGKKAFHCIEIVDAKEEVVQRLQARWRSAKPYA